MWGRDKASSIRWGSAIFWGVTAFVVGYLLTRHFVLMGESPETVYEASENTVSGWYYYNAQMVSLVEHGEVFGESIRGGEFDLIDSDSASEYHSFLYVIPPIVLTFCGVLHTAGQGRVRSISAAAVEGATIAVGYLVTVLVGLVLFAESEAALGISATLRPDIISSFLIAGIVYPVLFGVLGGVLYFVAQGNINIRITAN